MQNCHIENEGWRCSGFPGLCWDCWQGDAALYFKRSDKPTRYKVGSLSWKSIFSAWVYSVSIADSHKNQLSSEIPFLTSPKQLLSKFKTNVVETVSAICRWPLPDLSVIPWFHHYQCNSVCEQSEVWQRTGALSWAKAVVSDGQQEAFFSIPQFPLLDVSLY